MIRRDKNGFALPTILIASVIMLIVLIAATAAASSVKSGLDNQYYTQLAREAAESGLARAVGCLKSNSYVAQWSSASPLRPNTTCSGGSSCSVGATCYVVNQGNIRTTFEVYGMGSQNTVPLIRSIGTTSLLKTSNGLAWRSYESNATARIGTDSSLDIITFGQ